jgi:Ala-tRNA(Pro) deacylase
MSAVTEHLEQRGSAFELLPHRQAYTSTDEARALGIDADEVLKTLAVRTGPGYVLAVIPASCRLDLHLVRDMLGDHQARLASEEELGRDFAGYQLGVLPPLGALLGSQVVIDPAVLEHESPCRRRGVSHTLPAATCNASVRRPEARLLERITPPLTVGSDLGKRRSAQR